MGKWKWDLLVSVFVVQYHLSGYRWISHQSSFQFQIDIRFQFSYQFHTFLYIKRQSYIFSKNLCIISCNHHLASWLLVAMYVLFLTQAQDKRDKRSISENRGKVGWIQSSSNVTRILYKCLIWVTQWILGALRTYQQSVGSQGMDTLEPEGAFLPTNRCGNVTY